MANQIMLTRRDMLRGTVTLAMVAAMPPLPTEITRPEGVTFKSKDREWDIRSRYFTEVWYLDNIGS